MAAKKSPKTSKTAHVLNLLSGIPGAEPADTPEAPAPVPQEPSAAAASAVPSVGERHPLTPPILEVARANTEALSEAIHSALEDALLEELNGDAAPPEADPDASFSEEPPPLPEEAPGPISGADASPCPEPSAAAGCPSEAAEAPRDSSEESAPSLPEEPPSLDITPIPEAPPAPTECPPIEGPAPDQEAPPKKIAEVPCPADSNLLPDGSKFINVMELLVEEKLPRYVAMFGLCQCPRCLADVKALALTNLPTKYVVIPAFAESPYMEIYRGRYSSAVTAQILYACKAVMDEPRHTLPDNS